MVPAHQIPSRFLEPLTGYVKFRQYPQSAFLLAVLENSLSTTVVRMDAEGFLALPQIIAWLLETVPTACWGSPEKVTAWLNPNLRVKCGGCGAILDITAPKEKGEVHG